ncbi:MAG: hypothetical protein HPY53_14775 [Brevinematales bacterium]|nr:hypothetical protein [Brevinematales bacterium]
MKGMKNIFTVLGIALLFTSCGLLFTTSESGAVTPLALTGGTPLSTDDYNEKCPFLYRNSNGTNYLFFSSDRAGSYDLYYAAMDNNGNFSTPVKLGSPYNEDGADETYPVLVDSSMGLRLAFIRTTNSNSVVFFYTVDANNFSPLMLDYTYTNNVTGLGCIVRSGVQYVMAASGTKVLSQFEVAFSSVNPSGSTNLAGEAYSFGNMTVSIQTNGYAEVFAKDSIVAGKHQISLEGSVKFSILTFSVSSNINLRSEIYQSGFNDISPFIDYADGAKLYFASDRYGKGNYDLYRYNIYTVTTLPDVQTILAWDKTPPSLSFVAPVNNQNISTGPFPMRIAAAEGSNQSGVYGVYCSLNNSAFMQIPYGNGTYDKTLTFNTGDNSLKAYAIDKAGNVSQTVSITVIGK